MGNDDISEEGDKTQKVVRASQIKKKRMDLSRLGELQESKLLVKVGLIFILPNLVLGVAALFSPYLYMLIPVYET